MKVCSGRLLWDLPNPAALWTAPQVGLVPGTFQGLFRLLFLELNISCLPLVRLPILTFLSNGDLVRAIT